MRMSRLKIKMAHEKEEEKRRGKSAVRPSKGGNAAKTEAHRVGRSGLQTGPGGK
jgi:hypothetical protein